MALRSAPEAVSSARTQRAQVFFLLMAPALVAGCSLDRGALAGAERDGGMLADTGAADAFVNDLDGDLPPVDAYVMPGTDAAIDAASEPADGSAPRDAYMPDAFVPPDAWVAPPDAFVPPDAWVAPPDAFVPPDAWVAPCVAGTTRCISATTLERCDGTAWVPEPCALGCSAVGGAHCAVMIPSNVDPSLVVNGGDITVSTDQTWDTDACSSLPGMSMRIDQLGGPGACLVRVRDLVIASGATVTARGSLPLIVLAQREIRVAGDLDLSAVGGRPGAGGGSGSTGGAGAGGAGPGGNGAHAGTYSDGGGGGGALCGGGGWGGTGGAAPGGSGAAAVTTELSPLIGGSGGGRGGTGASAGAGGGGGGAVQLTAFVAVRVTGRIYAGGGGGRAGRDGNSSDANIGAGGGGGSGGAVLIESPTLEFSGLIRASGGGGGGAAGCRARGDGSDGTDGATVAGLPGGGARGPSCSGGDNYGAAGGAGGADATLWGAAGGANGTDGANGGGGGGGAGCIVLRRPGAAITPGAGATSPRSRPACARSRCARCSRPARDSEPIRDQARAHDTATHRVSRFGRRLAVRDDLFGASAGDRRSIAKARGESRARPRG